MRRIKCKIYSENGSNHITLEIPKSYPMYETCQALIRKHKPYVAFFQIEEITEVF